MSTTGLSATAVSTTAMTGTAMSGTAMSGTAMSGTVAAHAEPSLDPLEQDRSLDLVAAAADSATVGAIELAVAGMLFILLIVLPAAIIARDLRAGRPDPGLDPAHHEGPEPRRDDRRRDDRRRDDRCRDDPRRVERDGD